MTVFCVGLSSRGLRRIWLLDTLYFVSLRLRGETRHVFTRKNLVLCHCSQGIVPCKRHSLEKGEKELRGLSLRISFSPFSALELVMFKLAMPSKDPILTSTDIRMVMD